MAARLRSDLQVSALQRTAEGEGLIFTVLKKGHEEGGMILLKWVEGREARLFAEGSVGDDRGWIARGEEPVPEYEANETIRSEESFDPDLWVVEVMGSFDGIARLMNPLG